MQSDVLMTLAAARGLPPGDDPVLTLLGVLRPRGPKYWTTVQTMVRDGTISDILSAGDVVNVIISGSTREFDVLGIDEDSPVGDGLTHSLGIQAHPLIARLSLDPPQYLFAVTAAACAHYGWDPAVGMPPGTYHFGLDNFTYSTYDLEGTYQFTTTKAIPVGGGIRHNAFNWNKDRFIGADKILCYAPNTVTINEYCALSEGSGGADLGTTVYNAPWTDKAGDYINYFIVQNEGSNRWSTSWLRQYLNSDEAVMTWTPKTIWSRNVTGAMPEGFRHALDPALNKALGKVRKRYSLSDAYGGGYEDVEDYVSLLTYTDITGNQNHGVTEGAVDGEGAITRSGAYTYWAERNTNADRIKYWNGTANTWDLGANGGYNNNHPSNPWDVNTAGGLRQEGASGTSTTGIAPCLYIT